MALDADRRPSKRRRPAAPRAEAHASDADGRFRVVIEHVQPQVNGGRFAIKRTVGDTVDVTAHVHADGHDVLMVRLRYRSRGRSVGQPWREAPMELLGNDEWRASFQVDTIGEYEYAVEAWIDRFLSWRHDLEVKVRAGLDVATELQEGAVLVAAAAERCRAVVATSASARRRRKAHEDAVTPDSDQARLSEDAKLIGGDGDPVVRIGAGLDDRLLELMMRHADRRFASSSPTFRVTVDRTLARFGAWYEMFPRSWGPNPLRSATFAEAAEHLPRIAALGFDIVYLPPIHPIGTSFRKGRGNALVAGSGDPGSPWAIGSSAGGHKSVEPGLGTLEDFDAFVAAADRAGLEVALDLAYQCSPDHPYVQEHPEWFRHRTDGTIKYAENPPKKYQDIYPFDFESEAWRSLWDELLDVVRFWIGHGVRIFRVDNPHTKPYPFWEWLIGEIRREHPDTIFLSEAFSRPKIMYYLAKLGFTQSYTYFTWRNTKPELEQYFTELSASGVREFFRPNLFTNTPDILHAYLQTGGPAAFKIRLILASTLGAAYGIYSGFELCEGRAVPGSEEYLNSEKYQVRHWDWDRPENIKDLIASVNRIRREHTALQFDTTLRFYETDNPHLLAYAKVSPDERDAILVIVNVDPHHMQHGWVRIRAADFSRSGDLPLLVHDLLTDTSFVWRGEWNYVRLDPADLPAHILQVKAS